MTKLYDNCYYIVANHNGDYYYTEGSFTEQEINKIINNFDIDEFLADEAVDEEFGGLVDVGEYAVYRQAVLSIQEEIDIGYSTQFTNNDGTVSIHCGSTNSPEIIALHNKRMQEIEDEVEALYGEDALVVKKKFN